MPRHTLFAALLAAILPLSAAADPCGMVPPITTDAQTPLVRIGAQKTYVFFKNGIECIALRPGFRGKVEHFGMLIPFPSPPEIRKLPDEVFGHVASAVDPPEVVLDFRRFWGRMNKSRRGGGGAPKPSSKKLGIKEVKVLRQEAVGMYQVAVLAAGSTKALEGWMKRHGYRYPAGMDAPVADYVAAGWCFVAVKTKVGRKKDAEPRAGMRTVDPKLPEGASFDGHVQAMGFRFKTDKLVVPMRLSAYNGGKLRNIVYLLAEKGMKIKGLPESMVRRQLTGAALVDNLTKPRPLRIIGVTREQYDKGAGRGFPKPADRSPQKVNGHAHHLFAGDLLAVSKGRLSHPHEEAEKELLRIGEQLQLRGAKIDELHAEQAGKVRAAMAQEALEALKGMTLTVIDGDFPQEHIAKHNLTFEPYVLPARFGRSLYDAVTGEKPRAKQGFVIDEVKRGGIDGQPWPLALLALLAIVLGVGVRKRRPGLVAAGILALLLALPAAAENPTIPELIKQLREVKTSQAAVKALVERGQPAVKHLLGEAVEGSSSMAARGWAIVALGQIGGAEADGRLEELHDDAKMPKLVRTWAAAARVRNAKTTEELVALAQLVPTLPALGRPVGKKLVGLMASGKGNSAEQLIEVGTKVPALQQTLAAALMKMGAPALAQAMVKGKNNQVRRQAAGYLGAMARSDHKGVVRAVVAGYQFDGKLKKTPWEGGALFLPNIGWQKEDARQVVGELIAWHVWIDLNHKNPRPQQQQIFNNIRSVGLSRVAGYQTNWRDQSTDAWLRTWGNCVGQAELRELLDRLGVTQAKRFATILAAAPKK